MRNEVLDVLSPLLKVVQSALTRSTGKHRDASGIAEGSPPEDPGWSEAAFQYAQNQPFHEYGPAQFDEEFRILCSRFVANVSLHHRAPFKRRISSSGYR